MGCPKITYDYQEEGLEKSTVHFFGQLSEKRGQQKNRINYYPFSGRILDNPENVEFVQVDILVKSDHGNLIYCGILNNYYLSPDGSIDKIYLLNVYRRSFSSDSIEESKNFLDKELDDRYYNMPGEYFVIFGREILNINVTYYNLIENSTEANE